MRSCMRCTGNDTRGGGGGGRLTHQLAASPSPEGA
jgi:hypothetical protein